MGRHDSKSSIQAYGSPPVRKSPSRRERSPTRHRTLNSDKLSSRNRSPKGARSRSCEPHSPAGVKGNNRRRHLEHRKSPPPTSLSTVRKKPYDQMRSQKNEKSRPSPPISPAKDKVSSRIGPSKRVQPRSSSPERTKSSIQVKTSKRARSRSPDSHSLSPRSRRLKRVQGERDTKKGNVRENEKNHSRKGEEKGSGRDLGVGNRRSELDVSGNTSNDFRSRHSRMCSRPRSPYGHHNDGERRSRSPGAADMRGHIELRSPRDLEQRNGGGKDSAAKMKAVEETLDAKEKQKPSFELSGKLAAETNRVRGVTLLFNEPPDARKPDIRWRLYVFKGGEVLNEPLYVHRQSCYLFGRERRVADIPTDHPSCSKQHAVLQYRQVEEGREDGSMSKQVRPYLMDLGSTNGTSINENKIEPQRYYELFEKDTIKFGNSSREYVLLHENSSG